MGIVLASNSPRRRELLKMIGIGDFRIIPDAGVEDIPSGLSPELAVCKIALQKARNVSALCNTNSPFYGDHEKIHTADSRQPQKRPIISPDDIIIAADTLVYLNGHALGKPNDERDAAAMLRMLSGNRHTVYTGVALLRGDVHVTGAEVTEVFFRAVSESEIAAYIKTGEPMDKAGAYGAQGRGALFIERLEGDFFNVMGLPLCRLSIMLRDFGMFL